MKKVIFLLCMSGFINTALADGTKNCYANQSDTTVASTASNNFGAPLDVYRGFNIFSFNSGLGSAMGCPEYRRIKIRIGNPANEQICIGMKANGAFYRVLDPNGNVALAGTPVPNSGQPGRINYYAELFQGPTVVNSVGGYTPVIITPTLSGDYWIEFNKFRYRDTTTNTTYTVNNNFVTPFATSLTPLGSVSDSVEWSLQILDITVVSTTTSPASAIDGRVHCKQWNFHQYGSNKPTLANSQEFQSPIYAYTTDSIINKISFPNSIQGINWTIGMNDYGVTNTLTPANNRKSILQESVDTIAKYELFLTPPDTNIYKPRRKFSNTTAFTDFLVEPICNVAGVWDSLYRFNLTANAAFQIDFLINLNGTPGYQAGTTDVLIPVVLNSGTNTVVWDGYDGSGNFVPAGTNLNAVSNYINYGVTHIPLFDIEGYRGIKIETLYPVSIATSAQILYYDDTALPNGVSNYTGCASPCHSITNVSTNYNTVNTWFNSFHDFQSLGTFTLLPPVDLNPIANATVNCGACTASASINYTAGIPPYSYSWSIPTETTQTISNLCAGIYTGIVTDGYGCKSTRTFSVTEPTLATVVTSTNNTRCVGGDGKARVIVSNGLPVYSYTWSPSGQTTSLAINLLPNTIYTVDIVDANTCSKTITLSINNSTNAILATTAATDITSCISPNGQALVTANGGAAPYSYSWLQGSQTTTVISNLSSGTYSVLVTDTKGCTTTETVAINTATVSAISNISAGVLPCVGGTTNLNVLTTSTGTNITYEWLGAGIISGSNTANPVINNLGFYSVNVTDNVTGCISNQTIAASSVNQNSVVAQFNTNVITGVAPLAINFNNTSLGATSYTWSFGNGQSVSTQTSPSYNYSTPGTYNVILLAKDGLCNSTARLDIKVMDPFGPIPQIFTPNGDAFNPTFEIKGLDFYPNNDLQIFNRWGNLVYTARSYKNDWDGTANVQGALGNNKLPAGTYYYILDLGDDKNSVYKGFVQMQY